MLSSTIIVDISRSPTRRSPRSFRARRRAHGISVPRRWWATTSTEPCPRPRPRRPCAAATTERIWAMPACPSSTASAQRSSRPLTRSRSKGDGWMDGHAPRHGWVYTGGQRDGKGRKELRNLRSLFLYYYIFEKKFSVYIARRKDNKRKGGRRKW